METLQQKIKDFPIAPGVYQFKNTSGEVIYVGKAKNLKARVSQYFGNHDNRPQLPYLMAEATDVSYTVVNSELESLFLENTLIKHYLPKYNIQLRDDKNYAFITIDYSSEIPQIGYRRKIDTESPNRGQTKILYFGPYSAAYKIRNTLNLIRKIFPFCSAEKVSSRPCFYYYLHRCPGVCIGKISLADYALTLKKIADFLNGNPGKIKKDLETEMHQAANGHEFEKAARLRDQCQALSILEEKQVVIFPKRVDWDIVSIAFDQGYACVNLFKIRGGKMQDKDNFVFETSNILEQEAKDELTKQALQTFLEQYYLETSSPPKIIYTQTESPDAELIEHILQSRFQKKIPVLCPQKGKLKELATLGSTNASEYLKNWLTNQAGHLDKINKSLEELKNHLNLDSVPTRIEGFDISNIQGTNAVGSMVVFKNGLPAKSEYRKFKIQYSGPAGGPDDFAMMKEMIDRRLKRTSQPETSTKKWPLPDLIVIDGGKGQLGVAVEILEKLHLKIPIIGLAKRIEEIFQPNKSEPLILDHNNPALQMLQRLRDEAHRYGITYHRALRSKQAVKSALDDIPGVGPKMKKLLKAKFGTVANIKKASLENLTEVVGNALAKSIKANL